MASRVKVILDRFVRRLALSPLRMILLETKREKPAGDPSETGCMKPPDSMWKNSALTCFFCEHLSAVFFYLNHQDCISAQ